MDSIKPLSATADISPSFGERNNVKLRSMQQRQIDNLKVLIGGSPLLSSTERSEWSQLMEVMNDKQLLELEHILTSYKKPVVEALRPVQRSAPISLSHIVNLPKPGQLTPRASVPVSALASPRPPFKSPVLNPVLKPTPISAPFVKKSDGFMQKMKFMLGEKELPSGPAEKQLPEHASMPRVTTVPIPAKSLAIPRPPAPKQPEVPNIDISSKPVALLVKKEKPPLNVPVPVQAGLKNFPHQQLNLRNIPEGATINITNSTVSIQPVKVSPRKVLEDIDTAVERTSSPADIRSNIAHISVKAQEENFRAGLKNTDVLLNAKFQKDQEEQRKQEILKQKAEDAKPVLPNMESLAPLSITLELFEDASKLSVRLWQNESHESLHKALATLIQRYGYHETIFSLEKSPLYEAYVNTGLTILRDSGSFETLVSKPSEIDVVYISRKDFEEFTDLLRKMQAVT